MFSRSVKRFDIQNMLESNPSMFSRSVKRFGVQNMLESNTPVRRHADNDRSRLSGVMRDRPTVMETN